MVRVCLVACLAASVVLALATAQWRAEGAAAAQSAADSNPEAKKTASDPASINLAKLSFVADIRPILVKRCIGCHGGDEPSAELSLEQYTDAGQIIKHRKVWEKVARNVLSRKMPPKGEVRLSEREIAVLSGWVSAELSKVDCSRPDPGRVTIRRLNRVEYNRTIRDLVGIDFRPADDFPSDDVGYGFDNIGDVLSIAPTLMEKYLDAAEQIVARAIVSDSRQSSSRFEAEQMQGDGQPRGGLRALPSRGECYAQIKVPRKARYRVVVRAGGDQAGGEPVKVEVRLDGRRLGTFAVKADRSKPQLYSSEFQLPQGPHRLGAAFVNDYYQPKNPDPKNRDRNCYFDYVELIGPLDVKFDQLPESHRRIFLKPYAAPATTDAKQQAEFKQRQREHARRIVSQFASRAFRRPAAAAEVERFLSLVDLAQAGGDTFEQGIALAVSGVLVSPHFLFRIERDQYPDDPQKPHAISEYELATRLSYFLWSSMPDDELFRLAAAGKLRDNLDAQVRRMMTDPKSAALVENFAGQWLQIRRLADATPDKKKFPTFNRSLRDAMAAETLLLFRTIKDEDRSLLELLDAPYTFVNETLAKHYGMSGVAGNQMRRVQLSGDQRARRGGVLAHASILTITSDPTRTSPVKRGKWILEQMLGTPPPPPPPGVEELAEGDEAELTGTIRERLEQHRQKPICAACHQRMDPLGFALENYDAVGRWREREGKFPIDASASLPDGTKVDGPAGLKRVLLARSGQFRTCLVEKMLTYALGRGLEYFDKCAVDAITAELEQQSDRFSALVLAIVKSDPFQKRRAKRGEES